MDEASQPLASRASGPAARWLRRVIWLLMVVVPVVIQYVLLSEFRAGRWREGTEPYSTIPEEFLYRWGPLVVGVIGTCYGPVRRRLNAAPGLPNGAYWLVTIISGVISCCHAMGYVD